MEPDYLAEQMQEGLYVAAFFSPETNYMISDYLERNNIPNPVVESSLHTTIVHSSTEVKDFDVNHTLDVSVNTQYSKLELWPTRSGTNCLVWNFFSPYLHFRFQEAMSQGATYDFDEYKPHVTLSYDAGNLDISMLPLPTFPIVIIGEYSETLDLGMQ